VSRAVSSHGIAALALAGAVLTGCPTTSTTEPPTPAEPCQRPSQREVPDLLVAGPSEDQTAGFPVAIQAAADDPDGIALVTLYYRAQGGGTFLPAQMSFVGEVEQGSLYEANIPGNYVVAPGVDYYVIARDAGPCADETVFPEGAPTDAVLEFGTVVVTADIPLYTDFETGVCDSDEDLVGGWTSLAQTFPDPTHAWRNDQRTPFSGSCSVSHSEGVPGFWECPPPEGDGTIDRINWLVSPAMDFTTKTNIALRWFERSKLGGPCAELHSVFVSTGAPDPGDPTDGDGLGDYVLVATDLPFPGSDWQASDWIDLSEFAGNDTVYVALQYRGGTASRWQIDDIYVGEPLADLVLNEVPELGAEVVPGAVGVELNLVLRNESTEYGSPDLSALLVTDDPLLTLTAATATFPPIGVGATGNASNAFTFDIDPAHADNSYLDFTLALDDGEGHLWSLPMRLLMGLESSVVVEVTPAGLPLVMVQGHGPVILPNYSEGTTTDAVGGNPWALNITEQAHRLPPGPGPGRWFLQVTNPGSEDASIDTWRFEVGGAELGPDYLPAIVAPGETVTLRYPRPPELVVESLTTTPDPAAPGGSVSIDSLIIRNDGASTVGGLNCILDSADPDASGFSTDILTFGGAPVGDGESAAMDQSASFTIAASHIQDEPIGLVLLCSDGFDSIPVQFSVDVPYGRPDVDSVYIDDSTSGCVGCSGDNDGYADPSETVAVFLTAINAGSLDLAAPLTATVSASPSSPASFTLVNGNNIPFGPGLLTPGQTATATSAFELGVNPSSLMGDRMVLDIVWTAGPDTWTSEYTIDVTGIDWIGCNAPEDPQGDTLDPDGLDLRSCEYRSDGTMLQVRLNAWTEFDPATQALWFLFYEAPSLYSVEFVPPAPPVLEDGCLTGNDIFPTVLPLTVDNQLTTSASVRIGLTDLNELGQNLQMGFATGYCGGFCDVYPNSAAVWPSGGNASCTQSQFIQINW